MKTKRSKFPALVILLPFVLSTPSYLAAQAHTKWQMHKGNEGIVTISPAPTHNKHGDKSYYTRSNIPDRNDAGWVDAPDPSIINFRGNNGDGKSSLSKCWEQADFTYFQTYVDIPSKKSIDSFKIQFTGMDDGARVTIFHKNQSRQLGKLGKVVDGSYVYFDPNKDVELTADLKPYLSTGTNRIVITQVDDCPKGNHLKKARILVSVVVGDDKVDKEVRRDDSITVDCRTATCGDVHIRTPDGLYYDFQDTGDYLLIASEDGEVVVQTRHESWPDNDQVSVITAMAASVNGYRVEVYLSEPDFIYVEDDEVELSEDDYTFLEYGSIQRRQGLVGPEYVVRWPNGFLLEATLMNEHMDVKVSKPSDLTLAFEGLLGNFNGQAADDLRIRGTGEALVPPVGFLDLYRVFGDSWRVSPDESLFNNGDEIADGPRELLPFTIHDLDEEQFAVGQGVCEEEMGITDPILLSDCILDVGVTGDPDFALSSFVMRPRTGPVVRGVVDTAGRDKFCNNYAIVAVAQHTANLSSGCGHEDEDWHSDLGAHYKLCLDNFEIARELLAARQALLMDYCE